MVVVEWGWVGWIRMLLFFLQTYVIWKCILVEFKLQLKQFLIYYTGALPDYYSFSLFLVHLIRCYTSNYLYN